LRYRWLRHGQVSGGLGHAAELRQGLERMEIPQPELLPDAAVPIQFPLCHKLILYPDFNFDNSAAAVAGENGPGPYSGDHSMFHFLHRRCLPALIVAGLTIHAPSASADGYPERPVRVIVPFAPGGPAEVLARLIAEKLSLRFHQQFYVENQPGAGGNFGIAAGARANPDGYTVTVVGPSFVVNPSLYGKVPYDPVKDFAPVTLAATSANVLVVHPSIGARTVQELVAVLKANPAKHSFAHPGVGTTAQLAGEMFRRTQSVDIVPVSFSGSAPAIQSALGGHTGLAFTVITPAIPYVKDGTLRGIAVTTPRRSPALPQVPTMTEAGIPDQDSDTLLGVLVPAQTPEPIVARLHDGVAEAVRQIDGEGKLAALGFEPVANTPAEFGARIKADIAKWARVIEEAHIKAP
jgi:tripartite-type tricarboxylate transporter receptor subunit TctC